MTREFLDGLLAEVQRRFYSKANLRTFYAHRRQLVRAVTWPASWWRQRGFRTELPPDRYRGVLMEVFTGIEGHGDQVKIRPAEMGGSGFFPAYLLKCIQDHYGHHGESLFYSAKPLCDGVAPGDPAAGKFAMGDCVNLGDLVGHATRNAHQRPTGPVLDLEELAKAHKLIGAPKRSAPADKDQMGLFGMEEKPRAISPSAPKFASVPSRPRGK